MAAKNVTTEQVCDAFHRVADAIPFPSEDQRERFKEDIAEWFGVKYPADTAEDSENVSS